MGDIAHLHCMLLRGEFAGNGDHVGFGIFVVLEFGYGIICCCFSSL